MSLHFSIITPERMVAQGEVREITLPTRTGEITVLPGHADLVTLLAPGEMRTVDASGGETFLAVSTGMVRITGTSVTILADTAERAEELVLDAVTKAKDAADAALRGVRAQDDVAYTAAAALLERELARYRVAHKRKK